MSSWSRTVDIVPYIATVTTNLGNLYSTSDTTRTVYSRTQ